MWTFLGACQIATAPHVRAGYSMLAVTRVDEIGEMVVTPKNEHSVVFDDNKDKNCHRNSIRGIKLLSNVDHWTGLTWPRRE